MTTNTDPDTMSAAVLSPEQQARTAALGVARKVLANREGLFVSTTDGDLSDRVTALCDLALFVTDGRHPLEPHRQQPATFRHVTVNVPDKIEVNLEGGTQTENPQ